MRRPRRSLAPAAVAAVVAIAAVVVGFTLGAPIAGGSDSYGYVSQAHLWATGRMREDIRLEPELVPAVPVEALVPLGYNLGADRKTIVPIYAAGLPLVMAFFELAFGPRAVFWVVPLLGGVAVWATYLLGRAAAGPFAGAAAAILLAASPVFLFQLTAAPMSDLPAAAWWTLALALLWSEQRWADVGAGLAAAVAILTRPNLVPVALVPAAFLLWLALAQPQRPERGPQDHRRVSAWRRLVSFATPVVVACLAVAAINTHLYGSPLRSGYESPFFSVANLAPNLAHYPWRLTELQTPAIWLALLAPLLAKRARGHEAARGREQDRSPRASERDPRSQDRRSRDALALTLTVLAFAAVVVACYLLYPAYDAHHTLRFLLPAMPALIVLLAFTLTAARLPAGWRGAALTLAVALLASYEVSRARALGAFDTRGEYKYALIGEQVARRLPENAILLSWQHSGSVRYYSGREIVRYDLVPPKQLDQLMKRMRRLGYHPYILLDDWELPDFQRRFENSSLLGALDWPPEIELDYVNVRLWDPTDRPPRGAGRTRDTVIVPWPFPR